VQVNDKLDKQDSKLDKQDSKLDKQDSKLDCDFGVKSQFWSRVKGVLCKTAKTRVLLADVKKIVSIYVIVFETRSSFSIVVLCNCCCL